LLLPLTVRALREHYRRPGERENAFGTRPKTRAAPLEGEYPVAERVSPVEELRREEDAHNSVERGDRQETAGNGHRRGERVQQERYNGARRESQSARPRPGRAHLAGFRRLGRELRQEAKSAHSERNGPETDGDSQRPKQAAREGAPRPGAKQ